MRKLLLVFSLFIGFSTDLFSISLQEALQYLDSKVLNINITARVVNNKGEILWTTEISKITVNGRSVKVKISGYNIIVITDITPYIDEDNTILLVSQGEVWIGSSESNTINHYATIKSVPVKSGERAFFFPLGIVESSEDLYTIQLEIQALLNNGDSD
ncbi:MAG: hypothetical protein DRP59_12705 [Spirochaetes bacterium]|nr:MAG: hypothetical protein DRP59_12705 [Spirochaetota bacterium]